MGKTKYYYNPETCQYERVRATFWNVLGYGAGVIAVGSLFFAGLFIVLDRLVVTDQEKWLYAENEALGKHRGLLVSQLASVESGLSLLRDRDQAIYEKLFDEKITKNNTSHIEPHNDDILQADEHSFSALLDKVSGNARSLSHRSAMVNAAFGEYFHITAHDVAVLQSVPTLLPVKDTGTVRLVSGYGIRINPFHKGKYMHPGIDFAAPRGTGVVATAPGKVTLVNRTSLKAGYGNFVEITHGNGFVTRYAHLEDVHVRQGQTVDKGVAIGTVGSSGGSIAPHLHYEILQNGENTDPMIFMIEALTSQEYNQLVSISTKQNQSLD